jgi:hypothetical protein
MRFANEFERLIGLGVALSGDDVDERESNELLPLDKAGPTFRSALLSAYFRRDGDALSSFATLRGLLFKARIFSFPTCFFIGECDKTLGTSAVGDSAMFSGAGSISFDGLCTFALVFRTRIGEIIAAGRGIALRKAVADQLSPSAERLDLRGVASWFM